MTVSAYQRALALREGLAHSACSRWLDGNAQGCYQDLEQRVSFALVLTRKHRWWVRIQEADLVNRLPDLVKELKFSSRSITKPF